MKKRSRNFSIELSNRTNYSLITIFIIAIIGVSVYALGAVPNPGHTISDLQVCGANEILQVNSAGTAWGCVNSSSIGGSSSSLWTSSGSNIYYNTGNVGIGTSSPSQKLTVNGNIQASAYYDEQNTAYYLDPASSSHLNDLRASILYDLDNTAYYVNPASTSKFNTINLGGVSMNSWPSLSVTTATASGTNSASVSCPSGYVRTGCSGYSATSGSDSKNRGAYPSGSNGCEAIASGGGNSIQVYAYCTKLV